MVHRTASAAIGLFFAASSAFAGGIGDQQTLKPMQAVSADFGQRHYVSFFTSVDRRCDVTVVLASKMDESMKTAQDDVQRLRLVLDPTRLARIETPNGEALQFACSTDASRMTLTALHQLADN
jgi:hypothetical protein